FWQQNYKTVFLIERDFSPYYHSPNDLLQYLDLPYCRDIIRAGLATLLTLDQMPPSIAQLQVRDRGNGTSLVASWDSVAVLDFSAYKVYVGRLPGMYDTSYTQTSRSRTIDGLTEGVRYIIGVSILDIAGREGMIMELSAIPRSVPLAPVGLHANHTVNGLNIIWRQNSEVDLKGYNLYRRVYPDPSFSRMNSTSIRDTMWVDSMMQATRWYYATAVDSSGNESTPSDTIMVTPPLAVDERMTLLPFQFMLHQNYPNPFNPSTQIKYEIGNHNRVELKVFDVLGREVATLVNEVKAPGVYVAVWNAQAIASGVYYVQLQADGRFATLRMLLMK
ncbi:MAG: T9SS type A sorting domain-containing protein, partial [Bacteroidota bacterium]